MAVTCRVIRSGLSHSPFTSRLNGLRGILSNLNVLTDTHKATPQQNLHSQASQLLCFDTTLKPWNLSQSSPVSASTHRIVRSYASHTDSDSLGHLVYQGRVRKTLKALKIFSLSTSAIGLCIQPYMWMTLQDLSLVAAVPVFTVVNTFVFLNPILIHLISKKYITELYFNRDTEVFTAYVLTFFARRETITFTADEVEVPDVPNLFAMLTVRGRPFFVHEADFTNTNVYKHLMGFDKPLDLTLLQQNEKDETLDDSKKQS